MEGHFNFLLVGLSILVAGFAAYSALVVLMQAWNINAGKNKPLWYVFGSLVLGSGLWAMHFIGMLAHVIPVNMPYDVIITLLSVLPAIIGAFFTLYLLSSERFTLFNTQMAALSLSLGISLMHFIGMEAIVIEGQMIYDFTLFIASLLFAHILASFAVYLITLVHKFRKNKSSLRLACAAVIGAAISGMHYIAMASVSFYQQQAANSFSPQMSAQSQVLSLIIAAVVAIFVAATILMALIEQRLQAAEDTARASQAREQDIIEHLANGWFVINDKGHIHQYNSTVLTMFSYKPQGLDNCPLEQLMPSITQEKLIKEINGEQKEIIGQTLILEGAKANGNRFPIEVTFSKMTLVIDFKVMCNCIVRDITSRVQLETQLRHAMKLESLGEMASGIAHEINTPIQYVSDNTAFLKESFANMITALQASQDYLDNSKPEGGEAVKALIEKADLNFLTEEIPLALSQSLEGLTRISTIVGAMKSFSHSSRGEMKLTNITEAIETTLTVAQSEWRHVAEVETIFDSSLPRVMCLRDEFNQVILNIVVNAAHAIAEKFAADERGKITIRTHQDNADAIITIKDNGTGMTEKVLNRIFDPFYTTKDVGKGTGQGLSMAYNVIVEQHQGKLYAQSVYGEGSVFTIQLPIQSKLVATPHQAAIQEVIT
ncbi:MHYT domain-containing protein [Thalassomonas actiniarum]|uniref:histidine kinase n=1 Tax=Thalassomonas actiniarum TaxID=485447 RepID=A0AAF0C2A6_9GAMM|nr:MHYT domain-containing protein [Thalassomonas actiniarum]WDD97600.1 PAS domain S-box protein [Thalassomonas actiniarum]